MAGRFPPQVLLRAQGAGLGVRGALFDVDGVLTDGTLFYGESGEQLKAFSVLDGHGLKLLREGGIEPVVISGRDSAALRRRIGELGVVHAHYGVGDKLAVAEALRAAQGWAWDELAAIGDDWPDLPLLQRAAFTAAPPQAHPEVLARVHHVTTARGGHGAAREFCDLLLTASGRYAALLAAQCGAVEHAVDGAAPPGARQGPVR